MTTASVASGRIILFVTTTASVASGRIILVATTRQAPAEVQPRTPGSVAQADQTLRRRAATVA
jgi:hypothetical protein